jgi:glutamine amidotransferase
VKAGIVDYRMGNLASVAKALEEVGVATQVSDSRQDLASCDLLVLPGVGNFAAGIANIDELGLRSFIVDWAKSSKPIIGICLGMQLLFDSSEEGDSEGLGILKGKVVKLESGVKVPHMGWNTIHSPDELKEFDGKHFYFVHSYVCVPTDQITTATTSYGMTFASAVRSGNIWGLQFLPEKSSKDGISLLRTSVKAAA